MISLGSLSSQPASPRWSPSVSRTTMGSFRIQTSSHTWLCSQLLPYFLHLSAPPRVLTSQQRLWKWEIGQQVAVTRGCVPSPLLWLSQVPLAVPAAFPTQLMTAARWTGGGCGKQQISWTQAAGMAADTREVHSFPSSTSPHMSCCHQSSSGLQHQSFSLCGALGKSKGFAYQIPCIDAHVEINLFLELKQLNISENEIIVLLWLNAQL